jgi:hypothetical protein
MEKYQKVNDEKYLSFLFPAFLLLALEMLLRTTVFKTIP